MSDPNAQKSASKLKLYVPLCLVLVILVVSQVGQVSAFSVRQLLGLEESKQETATKNEPEGGKENPSAKDKQWAETTDEAARSNPQLELQYIQNLIKNMNEAEKERVLSDPGLFKQAIENEAINRSVLSAAIANSMDKNSDVAFLMRRGAENILREAYINRLISNKLPQGFPSAEQVREYYDNNQSQFVLAERVHVWQIFFKKPEGADEDTLASLKKKAADSLKQLKNGKADFADMAVTKSEHQQSSVNGGYMGLIKSQDLLPSIKDPLLKLKQGELSAVVESESGFHILKRGEIVAAEPVEFDQVEPQIRKLLTEQAQLQLRKAIFNQASKEFPQDISTEKVEEWRLRLKTDTASN